MAAEQSVLGESLSVTGRVTGDGDLEIRGRVNGEVDVRGDLVIGETAVVRASLSGGRVTVRGALLGDVLATEAIVLEDSARVVGNLRAPRIAIALGAQIRGELDMGEVVAGERPAARAAARPAAAPAARPAARPVAAPVVRAVPPPRSNPIDSEGGSAGVLPARRPIAVAPPPSSPAAMRMPPEPVVPAIKKGAKASKKRA